MINHTCLHEMASSKFNASVYLHTLLGFKFFMLILDVVRLLEGEGEGVFSNYSTKPISNNCRSADVIITLPCKNKKTKNYGDF